MVPESRASPRISTVGTKIRASPTMAIELDRWVKCATVGDCH